VAEAEEDVQEAGRKEQEPAKKQGEKKE